MSASDQSPRPGPGLGILASVAEAGWRELELEVEEVGGDRRWVWRVEAGWRELELEVELEEVGRR